jgi:N-acetylglutamate synthase-like GNAT family acetyltransferase
MNKIRKVNINDINRVFEIETSCFPIEQAATKEVLKARINFYPDTFLILENELEIIGFINGVDTANLHIEDSMFDSVINKEINAENIAIFGVAVHPKYQRSGYARDLMIAYLNNVKKLNKKKVILTCKKELVSYYQQFGFILERKSNSVHGGALWFDMYQDIFKI